MLFPDSKKKPHSFCKDGCGGSVQASQIHLSKSINASHFRERDPTGGHLEICCLWAVLSILEGEALYLSLGCEC